MQQPCNGVSKRLTTGCLFRHDGQRDRQTTAEACRGRGTVSFGDAKYHFDERSLGYAPDAGQQAGSEGRPSALPSKLAPRPQQVCHICGKPIESRYDYCGECAAKNSTACLISGARLGRVAAQNPQAKAHRRETKRRHDLARRGWSPSAHPAWLTGETYANQIQPRLARATLSRIASAIGVSIPYASDIRRGRRLPHPRHWEALAGLVGVTDS
jgi:hypothetical protein